jgi:hypothetical protein
VLSWDNFRKALKAANPNLVFKKPDMDFSTPGVMVYLNCPGFLDKDIYVEGTSLKELLAIASPSFFRLGCPKKDVVEIVDGKKIWFRGYNNFFRQLLKMRGPNGRLIVQNLAKMKALLPSDALSRTDCATFKKEWMASLKDRPSDFEKKREWLKGRSKPIPGNGMPLDWERDTIYSFA